MGLITDQHLPRHYIGRKSEARSALKDEGFNRWKISHSSVIQPDWRPVIQGDKYKHRVNLRALLMGVIDSPPSPWSWKRAECLRAVDLYRA